MGGVRDEYKEWLVKHKKEGSAYKVINGVVMGRLASACWLTNLDHGKRHDPLAGTPLNPQELRNAAYHGPFVTALRKVFSNSANSKMNKWKTYVKADPKRQGVLEIALDWISEGDIEEYMAQHRHDTDIHEVVDHFESVIDWAGSVFEYTGSELRGLPWGRYYRDYHLNAYNKDFVTKRVNELMADPYVTKKSGIFEFILSNETMPQSLSVRVFDEATKRSTYTKQTEEAERNGYSNCPLCRIGHSANAKRIWEYKDMEADHVTAWINGGTTDPSNCQMLCKVHNQAKGNK